MVTYMYSSFNIHVCNTFQDAMELDLGKAEVTRKASDSMKEQLEAQVILIRHELHV